MAKNTTNIYSGPASKVELSGSAPLSNSVWWDIGYAADCKITWEATPIAVHDGQQYFGEGLGKTEVTFRQSDTGSFASASALRNVEGYIRITDVGNRQWTTGPALAILSSENTFGASDSRTLKLLMQKRTQNENNYVSQSAV